MSCLQKKLLAPQAEERAEEEAEECSSYRLQVFFSVFPAGTATERVGAVAPMGSGKGEKPTRQKVVGMRLEGIKVGWRDIHRDRIAAVISRTTERITH